MDCAILGRFLNRKGASFETSTFPPCSVSPDSGWLRRIVQLYHADTRFRYRFDAEFGFTRQWRCSASNHCYRFSGEFLFRLGRCQSERPTHRSNCNSCYAEHQPRTARPVHALCFRSDRRLSDPAYCYGNVRWRQSYIFCQPGSHGRATACGFRYRFDSQHAVTR